MPPKSCEKTGCEDDALITIAGIWWCTRHSKQARDLILVTLENWSKVEEA